MNDRLAEMEVKSSKATNTTSGPGLGTWIVVDPNQELAFSSCCEKTPDRRED